MCEVYQMSVTLTRFKNNLNQYSVFIRDYLYFHDRHNLTLTFTYLTIVIH